MWVDVRQGHVRGFVVSPEWVGPKDIPFTLDELHDILGSDEMAICDAYIGTLRFILLAGRNAEMHTGPTVIDVDARVFGPAIVFSGNNEEGGIGGVSEFECEYLESALELIAYRFDDGVEVDAIVLRMTSEAEEDWDGHAGRVVERTKRRSVTSRGW